MTFTFERKRSDSYKKKDLIKELKKAAEHFNYQEFGKRDFDALPNINASSQSIMRNFGTWKKGLAALKDQLEKEGITLKERPHSPQQQHSDQSLFVEMERIWGLVGQRPSRNDWEASDAKISYGTYRRRFSSWTNACLKFIEYKMGGEITVRYRRKKPIPSKETKILEKKNLDKNDTRHISAGLKIKVLEKDNFRCVFCGKSPVTDFGTRLHIDHIHAFSKGGKSVLENLQTLCVECNLGKGARDIQSLTSKT